MAGAAVRIAGESCEAASAPGCAAVMGTDPGPTSLPWCVGGVKTPPALGRSKTPTRTRQMRSFKA
jgi:hypothetical protein